VYRRSVTVAMADRALGETGVRRTLAGVLELWLALLFSLVLEAGVVLLVGTVLVEQLVAGDLGRKIGRDLCGPRDLGVRGGVLDRVRRARVFGGLFTHARADRLRTARSPFLGTFAVAGHGS
jgi:hypothetical protein